MGKVVNLASKYRPRTFEDVSEQDSVRIILENQIKTGNIKHAYLFCGGAGTGKTTTARIVADMMNQGQGQPMELDCASHNGVDDMRAIQEECKYRPIGSKYKIFIMDECFKGDSIVTTNQGNKKIKDIKPGDLVATSSGYNKVNNVFKKSVPNNRLIDIYLSNGNKIVTTVNHLFMTTEGWVEASKLEQGDELIVYNKLSELWERDSYKQKRNEAIEGDITCLNIECNCSKSSEFDFSTYSIYAKPLMHYQDDNNIRGWQIPKYEKWYTANYKEMKQCDSVIVKNAIFHKATDDEESELSDNNYTEMYDLSVDDDCTYFVNDILVHNCHMLTNQAWNSMLKILEEPPEYVIFLFCTTDPQKIIGTILSRVQRFNFSKISTQGIENRLKYIIESENNERESANLQPIIYEPEAVDYIARLARGGMRDSITTLEKCLDYSQHLTLQNVIKVTSGGVTEQTMQQLLYYVLIKDSKSALLLFNDIYMSGIDISLFVKLYTEFLQNCVKFILTENSQIVTLSDIVIKWLLANQSQLDNIRTHLLSCLKLNTRYSSEDLRVLVESWLIQECN